MEARFSYGKPKKIDYTPGGDVSLGEVVIVGDQIGIAHRPIAAGVLGALSVADGVYVVTGDAAIAAGKHVFWNNSAKKITETESTNKYFGVTLTACSGDGSTCEVRQAKRDSLPATNSYQVRGFTDSNYYLGPAGSGLSQIGTIRLVGKLRSVPTSGQKILMGRSNGSSGWYVATGLAAAGSLDVVGSPTEYGRPITFVTGDIGKIFTMHCVISGGQLISYIGGLETERVSCTPIAASAGSGFIVGRFEPATSYANDNIAIIDIATSNSAMTAQQIFDDASAIQSRTSALRIADIPSQLHRFNADDIFAAANWVSRSGSLTLTKNGTPTVEAY